MKNSVRVLRFCIVGSLNALITAFVIWLMMHKLKVDYIPSNILAYVLAQTNNFIWCKYWVFESENGEKFNIWEQMLFFGIVFGIAYVIQFSCLLLMVEALHCNKYVATFIGFCIYGVIQFLLNKKLTFKGNKK